MSVSFFGDYDTTETVIIPFNTFDSNDPAASVTITNLVAADVEIHKDGGLTQRASDNGVTVSINFDTVTGNHIVSIDLSDNSDAGFYAAGSRYQVRMEGTTVDAGTINAWIGAFSIGCTLRPTVDGRTLDVTAAGEAGLDLDNTSGALGTTDFDADFITAGLIADNALVAANFAASSLDGKGDWNVGKTGYSLAADQSSVTIGTVTTNTDMRGTDSAALASVVGALTDVAAAGDPTTADTVMQYVKQLINILIGTAGVTTFPAEAAPGNTVSLAEVIRAIHTDVSEIGAAGAGLTDLGGMSTGMKAEVNTEMADVIKTDSVTQPGQATPPAANSLDQMIAYLYKNWRNKKDQDDSTWQLYNDDAATVDQKATVSKAAGVATKNEIATGP